MMARRWIPFRTADWLAGNMHALDNARYADGPPPLDLSQFATLESAHKVDLSPYAIPHYPADPREIVMRPRSGGMSGAGLDWPLWSSRRHSQHILGLESRLCILCGTPERRLAEGYGPHYCSWRWTGRRHDDPDGLEMLCSWAADMAWTIKDCWLRLWGQ
jgi:hypothetical protein